MHASSYENMQLCYDTYVRGSFLAARAAVTTIDLGSADVNGTYRPIFSHPKVRYLGADLAPGPGVDLLMDDPYRVPLPDASADIVLSGQMLEHCEFFWLAFQEMMRILKPDGLLFLIAPSGGPIHRYPVDCYRFYPDAYRALAKYANCRLIDVWHDDRGPWKDLVGIFAGRVSENQPAPQNSAADRVASLSDACASDSVETPIVKYSSSPEAEVVAGSKPYLEVLKDVHAALKPRRYLEIGVRDGDSLALATSEAIGIDPAPRLTMTLPASTTLYQETSDQFFREHAKTALAAGVDLAFIDGMHLFENALRDFMHLESYAHPATVIAFDDVLPNHPLQAARQRQTNVWTGDVWKIAACLRKYRPDLLLLLVTSSPTGLLLVAGLDASSRLLREAYNPVVAEFTRDYRGEVPTDVLDRNGAIDADDARLRSLLHELHELRSAAASRDEVRGRLLAWRVATT
jgi:hypothetical protein